jgi:hypothetical protein
MLGEVMWPKKPICPETRTLGMMNSISTEEVQVQIPAECADTLASPRSNIIDFEQMREMRAESSVDRAGIQKSFSANALAAIR